MIVRAAFHDMRAMPVLGRNLKEVAAGVGLRQASLLKDAAAHRLTSDILPICMTTGNPPLRR